MTTRILTDQIHRIRVETVSGQLSLEVGQYLKNSKKYIADITFDSVAYAESGDRIYWVWVSDTKDGEKQIWQSFENLSINVIYRI